MRLNLSTSSWQWQGMRRSLAFIVEVEDLEMDCILPPGTWAACGAWQGGKGLLFYFGNTIMIPPPMTGKSTNLKTDQRARATG